jgi:hypothetical protein
MTYRAIHETVNRILNTTPTVITTVASFTDNSPNPNGTLVTVATPNLAFFGVNYVYFNSYVYGDVYQVFTPSTSTFEIDTVFISDDVGVNVYNVTTLQNYIIQAEAYLASLSCIDVTSDVYQSILLNYVLYLTTKDGGNVTEVDIDGKYKAKMDNQTGSKNSYYMTADQLSGGCLTKASKRLDLNGFLLQTYNSRDC